jgi:hypothetical protein
MPRPIGGYYWVMFLSRRCYGNTISPGGTTEDFTGLMPGDPEKFQLPVRKKIWVAAVDLDYTGKADPSHPAFLLPGQEIRSGNSRPFVSLDPCRPLGASCESGVDCCDGFCRETGRDAQNNPILQCVPPPEGSCSNLDEACVTVADCCDPTNLCVLGRCVYQLPAIR